MNNSVKRILMLLFCAVAALPAFVSCYDDDAIWDKLGELEERVDSLQNVLNDQVTALNALMDKSTSITSCKKNSDGSYTIELSNGTKFTALPDGTKFSSLVSCVEQDGRKYWATYDAAGNLVTLTDASNNPIPVQARIEVKIIDGVYYLVVEGKEYVTGYMVDEAVQIFSSCTPMTDESGEVYAVKLTVGEGWEVTLTVDGYKGVLFKLSSVNTAVISEYFIDYTESQTFLMDTRGIVDYVMQIPDGWRAKEKVDELSGEVYMTITAPAKETVAMGAAESVGDLKIVSVVEGGKAAVTKLTLSTNPYKVYDVTAMRAEIAQYTGVQKFFYGITLDYDQETVISQINAHLQTSADLPEGTYVSETPISKTHEEIYPGLVEGENYTFWSVPVMYSEGDDEHEAGYFIKPEMFQDFNLNPMAANIQVTGVKLLDADIKVKVTGVQKMYAGVYEMSETALSEIASNANNGVYEFVTDKAIMSYAGPASRFPDAENYHILDPETSYIAWVLPVEEGRTHFTASDIVYKEFKTNSVTAGGSLEASLSEPVITSSSITSEAASEAAAMIYYAYIEGSVGERVSKYSNESMFNEIVKAESFGQVRGGNAEIVIEDLMPETKMWIFAVPVDENGLYGKVAFTSASTPKVTFNNLTVSIEKLEILSDEATLKIDVTGGTAVDYLYWVGRKTDSFWVETCGSNKTNAAKFMAANPENEVIAKVMKANGPVGADGILKISGLAISKEHVALVLAKDENGNYSKAGYAAFETAAISLGTDYAEEGSAKWNEMKALIESNLKWDENAFKAAAGQGQGFASYAFDITVPTNLTAYINCFTTVAAINQGTKMDIMVELEETCLSKTSVGRYVIDEETGDAPRHPDWYDDNGRFIQGSQVNVYTMYSHGNPNDGQVTYFATGAHGETHCSVWNNGHCSNYEEQKATIAKLTSYEYWREYIIDFGNYSYMGDPNHAYSRVLKDEAKIHEIATQYTELYQKYYAGVEPLVYENTGAALRITNRQATGYDDDGKVVDVVTIMLKDTEGNYYDPMYFPVPDLF